MEPSILRLHLYCEAEDCEVLRLPPQGVCFKNVWSFLDNLAIVVGVVLSYGGFELCEVTLSQLEVDPLAPEVLVD